MQKQIKKVDFRELKERVNFLENYFLQKLKSENPQKYLKYLSEIKREKEKKLKI